MVIADRRVKARTLQPTSITGRTAQCKMPTKTPIRKKRKKRPDAAAAAAPTPKRKALDPPKAKSLAGGSRLVEQKSSAIPKSDIDPVVRQTRPPSAMEASVPPVAVPPGPDATASVHGGAKTTTDAKTTADAKTTTDPKTTADAERSRGSPRSWGDLFISRAAAYTRAKAPPASLDHTLRTLTVFHRIAERATTISGDALGKLTFLLYFVSVYGTVPVESVRSRASFATDVAVLRQCLAVPVLPKYPILCDMLSFVIQTRLGRLEGVRTTLQDEKIVSRLRLVLRAQPGREMTATGAPNAFTAFYKAIVSIIHRSSALKSTSARLPGYFEDSVRAARRCAMMHTFTDPAAVWLRYVATIATFFSLAGDSDWDCNLPIARNIVSQTAAPAGTRVDRLSLRLRSKNLVVPSLNFKLVRALDELSTGDVGS